MFIRLKEWRRVERGMSTGAVVIVAMPLILGAFGMGFDAVRFALAKRYAQGRLDMATQVAAATTYTTPTGLIRLGTGSTGNGPIEWKRAGYQTYVDNTARARQGTVGTHSFFQCPATSVATTGAPYAGIPVNLGVRDTCAGMIEQIGTPPPANYDFCKNNSQASGTPLGNRNTYGVRYTVQEKIPTTFLRIIGVQFMPLELRSEALIRGANC